jgi:hypothetical protein
MRPEVPHHLMGQIATWHELHRWERKILGIELRKLGLTYTEIRELIPVPKSTLSGWFRDIHLTQHQIDDIRHRTDSSSRKGIPVDTQWRRHRDIRAVRAEAVRFAMDHLSDPFFIAGVVLYWGEGSKTRNFVDVTNTDPAALLLFIAWARRYLDPRIEFQLGLHLHAGNDEEEAKVYWRSVLSLPDVPFGKTYFKEEGTGHRKNHLPHGVCRVRTRRAADNWHRVMVWIDVVGANLTGLRDSAC